VKALTPIACWVVNNPYFTEIIAGILGVTASSGRLVTIGNVSRDASTERRYLGLLRSQRVGSLILTGSGRTDPEMVSALQLRLDGFRAAGGRVALIVGDRCAAAGHPIARERVVSGHFTRDGGASAMLALLETAPEITAVFCLSDAMAVGALSVLRQRGIDVPRRMSVVGFDDISLAAELTPALSTVRVPLVQLGEAAMRMIIDGDGGRPRTEHFATELRLGGTTGSAPRD